MVQKTMVVIGLCLGLANAVLAQTGSNDTVLKSNTIEVIQTYKPTVKKAPKPEWMPQLPPPDTSRRQLKYDVPQQTLYYSFTTNPIQPLALGFDSLEKNYKNYAKLGAGNLSTLYFDGALWSLHGKDWTSMIQADHLSQKGTIAQQKTSSTSLLAQAQLKKLKSIWTTSLSGAWNSYGFYGFDTITFLGTIDPQKYQKLGYSLGMSNRPITSQEWQYNPSLHVHNFTSKTNNKETTLDLDVPFKKLINPTSTINLSLNGSFTWISNGVYVYHNNLVLATAIYQIDKQKTYGQIGGSLGIANNSKQYFLPNATINYAVKDNQLWLSAGFVGTVRKNTLEQLAQENPFIGTLLSTLQTRQYEAYGRIAGHSGPFISYEGQVGYVTFKDLQSYRNDPLDIRKFIPVYYQTNAVHVRAAAKYMQTTQWQAGMQLDIYSFTSEQNIPIYHIPTAQITSYIGVHPMDKLYVNAYVQYINGLKAANYLGNTVSMKGYADVSIQGEYQFIPQLNGFIQCNNLLNTKYERWYGYKSYGFNVYAGLRLKF